MDPIRVVNWLREDAIRKIKGKQGWLRLVLYDPSVVAERCKSSTMFTQVLLSTLRVGSNMQR